VLKTFNGRRQFNVQRIYPVADPHEIYFHFLECLQVHLQSCGSKGADIAHAAPSASAYAPNASSVTEDARYANLNSMEKAIIQVMKQANPGSEGVHVAVIARGVQDLLGKIDPAELGDAIDKLSDEHGLIYQGMDDEHYSLV
jgi:hypothetical protein